MVQCALRGITKKYIQKHRAITIIGANEKSMNGVFIVIVSRFVTEIMSLFNSQINLSIIRIPLSIILSLSFAFFPNGPTSGETEKGMTVPMTF